MTREERKQTGNMTEAEYMPVVNHIPHGRKNAISRERLASEMKMTDRYVRECIEAARRDGVFIVTAAEHGGYYIATDIDEIERQYRIDHARALSVLSRLKYMKQALKKAGRKV